MNEGQIIEGCKAGRRDAQKTLYETHARTMYSICLRYSADEHSAQDLLQDGFIKVFANIQSYEGRGSFEGWMKRVFINLALEKFRRNKTTNYNPEDIENLSEDIVDESTEDTMESISAKELLRMVQELPEGYATVFNLYAIEDYSHKEIAKMLNISEGTSRSQYVRARQALQVMVKQYLKDNM